MPSRRVATTLAAAVLAALGACSKEVGNGAQGKSGVGARIDSAIDRTQQKLSTAGEKAREDVQQATAKTQEALSNAVSEAKQSLQSSAPPYAPRQPVAPADAAAAAAKASSNPAAGPGANASPSPNANPGAGAAPATPASITSALTTGPSTEIKITPAPAPR